MLRATQIIVAAAFALTLWAAAPLWAAEDSLCPLPCCDCDQPDCCPDVTFCPTISTKKECGYCNAGWYVQADALIVHRNNTSINQADVINSTTGDTVLTPRDLDFPWSGGGRIFVGNQCCDGTGWEVGYFGINGRTTSATANEPNNLSIPAPLSAATDDFDFADTMRISWDWDINDLEFNVFRQCSGIQYLAGFRYFNLKEQFDINAIDSDGDTSDYSITSRNNLFGGQIGARTFFDWSRWRVGATGKAGVFANVASEHQTVFDNNNTFILRNTEGQSTNVAFVGDVDLFVTYQICKHIRLRAGYYFLWVNNLALAPDQVDFTFLADSGTHVRDSGSLFVNGGTFGFEASW